RADIGVMLAEDLAEIGVLVRTYRAAVLAQVEGVERVTFGGETLGHVALEEIIAEAVDVEHRAARRMPGRQPHERRHDGPVVVRRELELEGLESGHKAGRVP